MFKQITDETNAELETTYLCGGRFDVIGDFGGEISEAANSVRYGLEFEINFDMNYYYDTCGEAIENFQATRYWSDLGSYVQQSYVYGSGYWAKDYACEIDGLSFANDPMSFVDVYTTIAYEFDWSGDWSLEP